MKKNYVVPEFTVIDIKNDLPLLVESTNSITGKNSDYNGETPNEDPDIDFGGGAPSLFYGGGLPSEDEGY